MQFIINTPQSRLSKLDDAYIRRMAIQYKISYVTTIAAAKAAVQGIAEAIKGGGKLNSLQEAQTGK